MSLGEVTGFFGKLPALGDFVSRRLPPAFIEPWDRWLQSGLTASRGALGSDWLEAYLTSPVWRFALGPGICGTGAWLGVLLPSVDRVGRYFPLTVATALPAARTPFVALTHAQDWFAGAESAGLAVLEDGGWSVERLDDVLSDLRQDWGVPGPEAAAGAPARADWRLPIEAVEAPGRAYPALLDLLARRCLPRYSLWWTAGSERVLPCLRVWPGLPEPAAYGELLADAAQPGGAPAQGLAGSVLP